MGLDRGVLMEICRRLFAEEPDYEKQIGALQKEAEERLDKKVEELMKNIDAVGQK